jgi:phospholipase A-2-activating protein
MNCTPGSEADASENPWVAAQRFLEKHDLPSSYSEQVVEFIHKNTGGVQLGQGDANAYVDPFTGGSRYTGGGVSMGGAGGAGNAGQSTGYRDPFTGMNITLQL